jgi:flavin reductase (DIM6/NTAB) family NADH-FMN oxidoreductase RutF
VAASASIGCACCPVIIRTPTEACGIATAPGDPISGILDNVQEAIDQRQEPAMPASDDPIDTIELAPVEGIWERFFTVAPLVLVGTLNDDGSHNLAPKHMAMPLGHEPYFGFVCTPRHITYGNALSSGVFTVSYPRPRQIVEIGQTATPRTEEGKSGLAALRTVPARSVDGVLVAGAAVFLECEVQQIVEPFGENGLIVGRVVAAAADARVVRDPDHDDAELLRGEPLLAYVSPGRIAEIAGSHAFPFPAGFTW